MLSQYCVTFGLIFHPFEKLPKLESFPHAEDFPADPVHFGRTPSRMSLMPTPGAEQWTPRGLASWEEHGTQIPWTTYSTGTDRCFASHPYSLPGIRLACRRHPQVANFVDLKKVKPGNRKSSENVPALCVSPNAPGSTNFRFSSAVTVKLQHQLIHNQWRMSVL